MSKERTEVKAGGNAPASQDIRGRTRHGRPSGKPEAELKDHRRYPGSHVFISRDIGARPQLSEHLSTLVTGCSRGSEMGHARGGTGPGKTLYDSHYTLDYLITGHVGTSVPFIGWGQLNNTLYIFGGPVPEQQSSEAHKALFNLSIYQRAVRLCTRIRGSYAGHQRQRHSERNNIPGASWMWANLKSRWGDDGGGSGRGLEKNWGLGKGPKYILDSPLESTHHGISWKCIEPVHNVVRVHHGLHDREMGKRATGAGNGGQPYITRGPAARVHDTYLEYDATSRAIRTRKNKEGTWNIGPSDKRHDSLCSGMEATWNSGSSDWRRDPWCNGMDTTSEQAVTQAD
ncbi:hypothetical protein CERSUDRAFT_74178 [Gelatoporia subvermispora B]|uniref:Uncharacterized protein n=1 Tax=Ceriporiopsis subvermispora (strain B) TaxID=914234 RepID=M2RFH0_CERS8|nr:hypothetical protein CERSUDRAFT_74178 [Gelatoporia subvermispora B]